MTRFEVGPGFSLNVEVGGRGPAIVLLHGFSGSARGWGEFGRLLEREFTTVAVDIVGHGSSDSPRAVEHYRMAQVADDLVKAVQLAGFERATWLGYSMGGRAALHIAAAHPEAVESLVVIGGSPGLATHDEREARVAADEALAERIERDGVPAFVDYWESIPLFDSQKRLPRAIQDSVRAGRLACNPQGLANSLRGMGTGAQEPLHERLSIFEFPVLLMAGAEDAKFAEIAREMAAAIQDSRVHIIPEAGHAAQLEQPDACAERVRAFVTQYRGQGVAL